MKTTNTACDRCHRQYRDGHTVRVITGREPDPSGNGYIDTVKMMDFCDKCLTTIVETAYKNMETKS